MPPRPIWSGSISFGHASVPVRMFPATRSREVRFHFVDRIDLMPVGHGTVQPDTGEPVDSENIVRAFEIEKGRYVPIEPDDLDRLDVELTRAVHICGFVSPDEIDPVYLRQAYFLAPQEGAERPFRLLARALEETGRVGIAEIVIRDEQHLACLRPYAGALVIETMYDADEVCEVPAVCAVELQEAEVEMASALVENLTAEFVDLMQALRESIERTQRRRARTAS